MKIKKSHLKELIRQSIRSIVSEADDGKYVHIGYGRYKKKGQEDKEGAPTFKKTDVGKFVKTTPEDDDVGGPAHVNVPKKEPAKPKTTKISADPFADDKPTYIHKGGDKLKSLKVRHPEKPKSKAPKPGEEFTIDQVMNATIKGDKVGDILDNPKHPNYDKAEKYASQFDPDDEKLISGKGAQVKGGPKPGDDWDNDQIMNATIGGDKVSDVLGNDNHPANAAALKYVMQFDPDDEKVISGKGGKDWDKHAQDAAAAANAKMDADEKKKKKKKESVRESKGRRCTVKEIKQWMRTLEENRYKKTYNSDCRRVSWMVNNSLSEDYDTMPVSMQKKWPKAAYKRERFLAKEFIKHLRSKQMNEIKLRKLIRKTILKELRG